MRFSAVTKFVMLAPDGAIASPDLSARGGGGPSHRHDRRLGRSRCVDRLGSRVGRDRGARRGRDRNPGRDLRRLSPLPGVPRLTAAVTSPRPAPQVFMPVIAGSVLIALALPIFLVALLALTLPSQALARGDFDPTTEFEQHEWVPIHIGPLDLSITKAVVYLMLGSVLTIALGTLLMRWRLSVEAGTRQTFGETIYDVAQTQIAEQGLPSKAIQLW